MHSRAPPSDKIVVLISLFILFQFGWVSSFLVKGSPQGWGIAIRSHKGITSLPPLIFNYVKIKKGFQCFIGNFKGKTSQFIYIDYFAENNYFGADRDDIVIFEQRIIPAFDDQVFSSAATLQQEPDIRLYYSREKEREKGKWAVYYNSPQSF